MGTNSGTSTTLSAEEWKKKQQSSNSTSTQNKGTSTTLSAEEWKTSASYNNDSALKVNSFVHDANAFFSTVGTETTSENIFNAADFFEERKKQAEELKQRAADLSEYMANHMDSYTQESYDSLMEILSTFDTSVDDVMTRYQPSLDSKAGMAAYEDEYRAAMERNAQQQQVYEIADRYSDYPVGPAYDLLQLVRSSSMEDSSRAVTDNWTAEQRYRLGIMQKNDPVEAQKYAAEVNAGRDPYLLYQQQEQQKAARLAMDLDSEKREIDQLKADLEDFTWNTDYDATSVRERKAFDEEIKRREKEISDREQEYNLAKREQESEQLASAANNSDFTSRSGYVSSGFEMPAVIEDADPDELVYEYINNPDVRSQINKETTEFAAKGYDLLDEKEVGLYNYYYATEGPEKAQQYLDNIQDTLNKRFGVRGAESKKDSLWKQYMAGAVSGYSNAVTSPQYFFDKESDYINTSPFQYMSAVIREDLADTGPVLPGVPGGASLGQIGYDIVNTTANMAPSILLSKGVSAVMPGVGAAISALGGKVTAPWLSSAISALGTGVTAAAPQIGAAVGSTAMGLSAAGGAYQQALNAGYSKEQSRAYAALSGAAETGMEYLLGGISKLGGEIPQRVLKDIVSGVDNAVARAAIKLGGSMASEGFEEGLQEVITPWLENLILYADKDVDLNEVAYSTLLGALSGGFMEGTGVISTERSISKIQNQLKDFGAKGNTKELAELIVKHRSGEELSQEEYIKLAKSEPAMQVLNGVRNTDSDTDSGDGNENESVAKDTPVTTPKVSSDGKAIQISTNETIETMDFASVNNGKATIQLKSGDTAEYSDVSFASEAQANQFYAAASLPGIDTENANDLLHTIQDADAGKDIDSVVGIREAYGIGYFGMQESDLESGDAANLSPELRKAVFDIGRQQRAADAMVKATAKPVTAKPSAGYKKVVFEGKTRQITKKQKSEIEFVDYIAENFSGNTVHVFESYKGRDGKYYYRDNNGKVHRAPNGKYVNGEIWLDLKSGDNQEGLVLNTFAHEMYHHIEKFDKAKAQELAEFVAKELGKKSVDDAVAEQIKKARKAGLGESYFQSRGMTAEQARNEVYMRAMSDFVADSLETMFTRGDPAKAIANLKKENRTLFDEIKAFIDKWVSKLKEFYSDKTISKEGEMVAQLEKFEQLQQLFMEGVQSAGENYRAALSELTPGEAGEIVNADGELAAASTKDQVVQADRDLEAYSLRNEDSDGNILTDDQKDYFKHSLARDENGNLLVLYHGTKKGGFTIYDPKISKDGLFLTDRKEVARTYSGTGKEYAPKKGDPGASGEMNYKVYADLRNPLIVDAKNALWRNLPPLDPSSTKFEYVKLLKYRDGKKGMFRKPFEIKLEVKERGKEHKVLTFDNYIACMNYIGNGFKQIIPDEGKTPVGKTFYDIGGENNWNTRQYCAYAKEHGFDGVIFRNIITPGSEMVNSKRNFENTAVVAFNAEQVKSVNNLKPTNDPDIRFSIRNQQPTTREILSQIDPQTQKANVRGHLTKYQERVEQLGDAETRREEVKTQIETLSADPKKNRKELAQLRNENRNLTTHINGLKEKLKFSENTDMMRKIVANERLKNLSPAKHYKDEQEDLIRNMQAEHRVIRKELTGADSVMFVMEDTFVKLAKDYEAKKIDMKTMEKEFMRIMKEYEEQTENSGKQAKADSEKIDTLTEENEIWLREYKRLMKEYDLSDRKIASLEATIARQRATAKARVEGRRNTEMRHKIQRKVNELDQLLRHGSKHRNVPEFLQSSVAEVLNAINMEVRDGDQRRKTYEATLARYDRQIAAATDPDAVSRLIEKRNEYAAKGDQFANRMETLKKAYAQIREENTGLELDEGIAEHLNSLFETVGNTPLGQMTAAQLDAVNDILNVTMATVRNANEMLAEARTAGVVETSKSAITEIKSAGETKKTKTRFRKGLEQFGWNNLKPEYALDVIGSKTLKARYDALRKGEDTLAVDLNEAKEFFQDQWKKNGGKDWDMDQKWKFTSTSGKSFELDLNQIMSLYALAKDKDARSHLRVGGFAFDSDYQTKKRGPLNIPIKVESTDASAYNLSDEILGEIISKLTHQQRAFADAMQAYLSDTMAAKGNEVSLKKYGIRLFKNKDYFPLPAADQFMAKAREQQTGERKLKNSGFTNKRKPEAKNPVVLSGFTKVWAEHVDEMSLYHSFVLPLDDFNRVLNYHDAFVEGEQAHSVVEAITNAFGKGATNYLDQLIKDVNGGIKGGSTVSFANRMMSKAKKAQTMASLSVAIQQPSSILRAMSEVDLKYFLGPKVTEKTHDRTWEEIKAHAPIAIIKEMGGYDTNVGKSTVDYLTDTAEYNGFGEKFKAMFTDEKFRDDKLGRFPALMDEVTWGAIWNAVKREQSDLHPGMDVKSDAFMNMVANRFTEVITRTQVYDSVFSRSGLMRDRKSDLAKMTTSFMAEPTTTANMLAVSILQAKRGDIPKKQAVKTTASIVASLALNAALVSFIYAMRDDDEDKRYDEKLIENFYSNFFESLNPLGYIPYVRDIYNLFAKGYDVERADMELFGDLQNAIDGLDNDDLSAWEKTENVIGAIGNLVGVPLKNILRDSRGVAKTIAIALDEESKDRNTNTGKYMARRGMDLSDGEELLLAIQRGDDEHIQRVAGRYENQQEAEGALQRTIREKYKSGDLTREEAEELLTTNFDREDEHEVYWLLEEMDYAKEHGSTDGYAKYGTLYEAVESGGDYESEIARLMEHGAEASTIRSQITKKYHDAYLKGDEAARKEIQDKLQPVLEAAGMDVSDIEDKFSGWDFEAEYGMTYSEFKSEYREGNVTEAEMRNAMKFNGMLNYEIEEGIQGLNDEIAFVNKYDMTLSEMKDSYDDGDVTKNQLIDALVFTGKTRSEATSEVTQRDISNRYGIDYMKLDDAYKYGDISRQTLYNSMIENGATKQEADDAILGYDWLKKHVKQYPDLTISVAKKFAVRISADQPDYTLEDFNVKVDDYIEYSKLRPDCKGVDNNGDGQADSGTKRDAIFKMIDSLPISSDAKDGLALIDYGMKSIRKNAPWH